MYFIPYSFLSLLPNSFFACLGLMAGIFGYYLHGLLPLIITVGSGIIFWHYQERASQSWLIFLFFMMAGGLRIAHQIKTYRCFPFEKYKKPQSITGTITGLNTGSNNRLKKCITLYVPAINNYIQLYTKPYALGTVGDTITIKGVQLKPPNNSSYQDYLHKEGILCSLFLEKPTIILNHHPSFCLARILYNCREYLLNTINKKCSYKTFCLFSALFLGEKSRSKQSLEPISDQFKEWGIVHFLARSGLHLVIFVLLWELLLGCIPLRAPKATRR